MQSFLHKNKAVRVLIVSYLAKLLESKRCRPADMYLQSKLMLRLNEREEKVKETIRGIREKLKQNKVLTVSLFYLE